MPEIEGSIAWNDGKERIQKVVALLDEDSVVRAEYLEALRDGAAELRAVEIIKDNDQGKLAKVVPVDFDLAETPAEIGDQARGSVVDQHLLRVERSVAHVVGERRFGIMEV